MTATGPPALLSAGAPVAGRSKKDPADPRNRIISRVLWLRSKLLVSSAPAKNIALIFAILMTSVGGRSARGQTCPHLTVGHFDEAELGALSSELRTAPAPQLALTSVE